MSNPTLESLTAERGYQDGIGNKAWQPPEELGLYEHYRDGWRLGYAAWLRWEVEENLAAMRMTHGGGCV